MADRNKTPAAYARKQRYREKHREELRVKSREYQAQRRLNPEVRLREREAAARRRIPIADGGAECASNVAVSHPRCNRRRGKGYLPAQLRLVG